MRKLVRSAALVIGCLAGLPFAAAENLAPIVPVAEFKPSARKTSSAAASNLPPVVSAAQIGTLARDVPAAANQNLAPVIHAGRFRQPDAEAPAPAPVAQTPAPACGCEAPAAPSCACACNGGGSCQQCAAGGSCDPCGNGCGGRGGLFGHGGHGGHHHHRNAYDRSGSFHCGCNGSYKFPVPPLSTYHWPGMYSHQLMTDYHSPWRFPPIKPYLDEVPLVEMGADEMPGRFQPAVATYPASTAVRPSGEIESMSAKLLRAAE